MKIKSIIFMSVAILLAACASVPDRLAYQQGVNLLASSKVTHNSIKDIEFENLPEAKKINWYVGLDDYKPIVYFDNIKSFYKAFVISKSIQSLTVKTYPTSHNIHGDGLYIFKPNIIFYDKNHNQLKKIDWSSFNYEQWGMVKHFSATIKIPEQAHYCLTLSTKESLAGYTPMALTSAFPILGDQIAGELKNAPIGTVTFYAE